MEFDQTVKECTYGALGVLVDDWSDCKWQHYRPELPIFEIQATDFADYDGSYWPYTCVNFYSAEWESIGIYPLPGHEQDDEWRPGDDESGIVIFDGSEF